MPQSQLKAPSIPATTSGKEYLAKVGIYPDLFTQHSAGKKTLLVEETTEQRTSMAEMRVYSRYATSGKEMQKKHHLNEEVQLKNTAEFSNLIPF